MRKSSALTVTDQFCGAGGSSLGATAAGAQVVLAMNHWKLAVETHNTNFPDTLHDCTDISACDPRRYPRTDILITSPECTNHSMAKGRKRKQQAQLSLWESPKIDPAAERSRATMYVIHNRGKQGRHGVCSNCLLNHLLRVTYMQEIQWKHFPLTSANSHTREWLEREAQLSMAPNTLKAYGRAMEDYLSFCQRTGVVLLSATKTDILGYIDDLNQRPNPRGDSIRYLHSGHGLANATMHQRLTVVKLFYDYLLEEDLRQDRRNPVGRGKYTPGRTFSGRRDRSLLPRYQRLPWLPGDDEWSAFLEKASLEPLRNRLMVLLAYDGALRRSELVALEIRDILIPYKQIIIREEIAKNGKSRVVMYGTAAQQLLQKYLEERAEQGIRGGHLFRSCSPRNRACSLTAVSWDKIVERIAKQAGLHHRFTTHTFRHLRLTDLARAGLDIHVINRYAGHSSIETTKLYIHLSGRETAEPVRKRMQDLDRRLERLLQEEER